MKNIKIKDEETDKKNTVVCFSKQKHRNLSQKSSGMKAGMQKYTDMCIIKTAAAKLNTTETRKGKQKKIKKRNQKN